MAANDPSVPIDVDLARSTSGVWLVKMPKYLSAILSEFGDGAVNGEVGRLVKRPPVQTGKDQRQRPQVDDLKTYSSLSTIKSWRSCARRIHRRISKCHHANTVFGLSNYPVRYSSLSNISDGVLRTVFTRSVNSANASNGEQISIVGKVIQRAEVRPVDSAEYMSMKRKQFEDFQEPARKAQMITKKVNPYVPKRDHEANKQRMQVKKLMGKRVRSSEEAVLELMFAAFSKNQYISMAGLETVTQQPKNFLQQLVKRYCNYNNAGHNYELKPQFRDYNVPNNGDDDEEDDMEDDDEDDEDDDTANNNTNDNA